MTIRITGMNSGLDTEAIISELASARSIKVQKIEKNQTKLSWKIDAWKELNTKIYSLYSDVISDMRYDYAYAKKTTKVSNADAVTVMTAGDAMNGVQSLKINQIAKTGYLTGGKLDASSGDKLVANMPGLEWLKDSSESVTFKVRFNGEDKHITLNGYDTLNGVAKKFEEAGLNAKYDEASKRFFITSKETGKDADFTISHAELREVPDLRVPEVSAPGETISEEKLAEIERANAERDRIIAANNKIIEANKNLGLQLVPDEEKIEFSDSQEEIDRKNKANANRLAIIAANNKKIAADTDGKINAFNEKSKDDFANTLKSLGLMTEKMASEGGYNVTFTEEEKKAGKVAGKIDGEDAEIELNGAIFTSNTNNFEINGLTLTVHKATDEVITLTTEQDTSGIYDTIKNFIKKYSELINEMDKLYNAESASKYEPLTKEEKEALSDTEVEEWEKKIKESLLRRDTTLSSVSSALKTVMMQTHIPGKEGFNDGKDIYLSAFGIETLGYFKAKDNEKNAYHINGDPDDTDVKNYEDKLKKAIATDPDTVVEFFKELATNMYNTLEEKMEKTDYSSRYTVYKDIQMASELKEYDSKIATEQKKLNDYIDRWYEKFSQMEVALGKLNSKESSISSLFG